MTNVYIIYSIDIDIGSFNAIVFVPLVLVSAVGRLPKVYIACRWNWMMQLWFDSQIYQIGAEVEIFPLCLHHSCFSKYILCAAFVTMTSCCWCHELGRM